jgi:hypothetical protein
MDGDWTHPVAHGKSVGDQHHTHEGHGCSEDRQGQIVSAAEYSRLLCVVGVLTERLMVIAADNDPEKGHEHVIELYDEELVRVSTKNLKMYADPAKRCIRLKVED